MPTSEFRKRKLQRRQVLQRKKCRTVASTDILLESSKESGNNPTSDGAAISHDFASSQTCADRLKSQRNSYESRCFETEWKHTTDDSHNKESSSNVSSAGALNTDDTSSEFQLCTARFTYGRSLQKSAKIVRRRTVHSKAKDEEEEKPHDFTSPFLRKAKGRRSFILRELPSNGKDAGNTDGEFALLHLT